MYPSRLAFSAVALATASFGGAGFAQAATGGQTVTVEAGDTVYALSRKYGASPSEIIAANGFEAPYALSVGQSVKIPGEGAEPAEAEMAIAAPPTAEGPIRAADASAPPTPSIKAETAPAALAAALPTPKPVPTKTVDAPAPRATLAKAADKQPIAQPVAFAAPTQLQFGEPEPQPVAMASATGMKATHTVAAGDTFYGISRRYEVELGDLLAANGMTATSSLGLGQTLVIPGGASRGAVASAAPGTTSLAAEAAARELGFAASKSAAAAKAEATPNEPEIMVSRTKDSRFSWPLRGTITEHFGMSAAGLRNDGINIAAPMGAPIRAAADGEVIYTGSELEGYGNLLLIRHADNWVSAYAHADSILVGNGDAIRQGQVVAKVGTTGSVARPQLHFELRHELAPRDPLAALQGRDQLAALGN